MFFGLMCNVWVELLNLCMYCERLIIWLWVIGCCICIVMFFYSIIRMI